jgi:fibronectin-binding autotransporter adhesin
MHCIFLSWVKPLGALIFRYGKWLFQRPKKKTKCRQVRYRRILRIECLGARAMLSGHTYYVDESFANPTIDASSAICHVDSPMAMPLVAYQNGADNSLVIQQTSAAAEQVTIGMNVVAGTFSLDANGPYTMVFAANTYYSVVTNTLAIASSTFTIDVQAGATGEIDGGISASSTAVAIRGYGPLTFGGSGTVTVAAMTDFYSQLTINNTVEITDANSSHNGLYIGDPASLAGTGTITLDTASTPLYYASTATSTFGGNIGGDGYLELNAFGGILVLSSYNSYTGGTIINQGEIQLGGTLATVGGPDANGVMPSVTIDKYASLDLKGVATTLGALNDGVNGGGRVVNSAALTTLTIATSEGTTDVFHGNLATDTGGGVPIRLVKQGAGTFGLGGSNEFTGGTQIDAGTLELDSNFGLPYNTPTNLRMSGAGILEMNGCNAIVSTLNADSGNVIINNNSTLSSALTVSGDTNPSDSVFAGSMKNGGEDDSGVMELTLNDAALTITGTANNYSGGTALYQTCTLVLGDGLASNGLVTGAITVLDEGWVYFNVLAGPTPLTFDGFIQSIDANPVYVYKEGPGTLDFTAAYVSSAYSSTAVLGGNLTLASGSSLPPNSSLTVRNGAVLDLGQTTIVPTLTDVSLVDGTIVNGALSVSNSLVLGRGEIDAAVSGTATVNKVQGGGSNTVSLGSSGDWTLLTGAATVSSGRLQVNCRLGSTSVTVSGAGNALAGNGATILGDVALSNSGTIDFDASSVIDGAVEVTGGPGYWVNDGTVDGQITVEAYGVLTIGSSSTAATLAAPGGVLLRGSGRIAMVNDQSALVASLDDEGWQSNQVIGGIQGAGNTLTVNAYNPNGTDVVFRLGQPPTAGPSGQGTFDNVIVTNGKLIIYDSGCVVDGASLSVGSDVMAYFAPSIPEGSSSFFGSTVRDGQSAVMPQSNASDTSTADDGPPPADPAVLAAQAAAQAAADAQAQAAHAAFQERQAAWNLAINAVEDAIDPDNQDHSTSVMIQACNIISDTLFSAMAANGGSAIGMTGDMVADGMANAFQSAGVTLMRSAQVASNLSRSVTTTVDVSMFANTTDRSTLFALEIWQYAASQG